MENQPSECLGIKKFKDTFVRLIFRKANTASALKSCPGPSSREKTMLVWISPICIIKLPKEWSMKTLNISVIQYLEWLVRARNNGFSSQHHKTGDIICVILYKELDRKQGIISKKFRRKLCIPGCFLQEYRVHKAQQLMN
jgi:hypothetical protein